MSLQRISVSAEIPGGVDPDAFVPVFHDWIRRAAVDGLLVDVATYAHVHHGPGVMLVGHEGDYSVDLAGGRAALRYTLKRDVPGAPREAVALALRRLRKAAAEAAVAPGVAVAEATLTIRVFDRLQAPNTDAAFAVLGDDLAAGVRDVDGERAAARVARESDDPRAPLGLVLAGA